MKKFDLTISIVLFKSNGLLIRQVIENVYKSKLNLKLYLIDNSPTKDLSCLAQENQCEYIYNNKNLGFGKAHNIAIRQAINESKYHLVLNPDISFKEGTLEALFDFMEATNDVGLVLPKVLDFDSQIQYVCKRLPSPTDLIIRRFGLPFFRILFQKRIALYEMRDKDYNSSFEAPTLSGCFMFFRTSALKQIGFFDERFFMYMEDVDISRRMNAHLKTYYYPHAQIFHGHARESYKINKLLLIHIESAIKYFNKWGWFLDPSRKKTNQAI